MQGGQERKIIFAVFGLCATLVEAMLLRLQNSETTLGFYLQLYEAKHASGSSGVGREIHLSDTHHVGFRITGPL